MYEYRIREVGGIGVAKNLYKQCNQGQDDPTDLRKQVSKKSSAKNFQKSTEIKQIEKLEERGTSSPGKL